MSKIFISILASQVYFSFAKDVSELFKSIPFDYRLSPITNEVYKDYAKQNTLKINEMLSTCSDDTVISFDNNRYPFWVGIQASNIHNLTIDINGVFDFAICEPSKWKRSNSSYYYNTSECAIRKMDHLSGISMFGFSGMRNFKLTSTSRQGRIVGGGYQWYGYVDVALTDVKPMMLDMRGNKTIGFELSYLSMEEPPYWTTYIEADDVEVHHMNIVAIPDDFYQNDFSNMLTMMQSIRAFNTDGIDISGDNVHIHDCVIHVGDDCVAVKGGSNWLVETVVASGLGMSIGLHGSAENITFQHIHMDETIRAIYVKAFAKDIVYKNITVGSSLLFPIWIGPTYQFVTGDCPLIWPFVPTKYIAELSEKMYDDPLFLNGLCVASKNSYSSNILLVDVRVERSYSTPAFILGNGYLQDVQMVNVTFGEVPNGTFPHSSDIECYNSTFCPTVDQYCNAWGDRGPSQPCCNTYNPFNGSKWGFCS